MNRVRKVLCSIACCFMILGNAPINIYATTEETTIETTTNEPEQQNSQNSSTQQLQDPSTQDPQNQGTNPESEEELEDDTKEGKTTESTGTPSADTSILAASAGLFASTYHGQSGNGQNGNSGGGTGAHIDVRIAASLTIESKVNGTTILSETISVDTSNVSGTFNGTPVSFTRKYGQGIENEWRASISQLAPATDSITISCTLTGTKKNGEKISIPFSMDYFGVATLNQFKTNCPDHSGYDIDIVANDISESFTVNRSIQKIWNDDNNANNTRPDEISVQLYADGQKYGSPITLSEANGWTTTLTNLPKYSSGTNLINYTVYEKKVTGYQPTYDYDGSTIKITNTFEQTPTRSITVRKVWDDKNNQDGIRSESIEVILMDDETDVGKITLSEENNWTYTFTGLDINKRYHVLENINLGAAAEKYTTSYSGSMDDGFIITNTHIPEVYETVTVSKVWDDNNNQDGLRPKSIYIYLYANGNYYDKIKLNEENDWSGSFENLPKNSNGKAIEYTIEEPALNGYTSEVTGNVTSGFTVTNTHIPEEKDITVQKVWNDQNDKDGIRPEKVQFELYQNGELRDTCTLSEGNDWDIDFTLHAFDEDGNVIEYSVVEINVADGYTSKVTGSALDDFTITNTHEITKKEDLKKKNTTNTGVQSSFYTNLLLFTLSGTGLLFLNKKRK
ncbi:Cna B-type domain-containing protein [Floccifex sp.]|uniref:Cna B-type domain-containing protein n=1 Tax=Floccifex sp. TaxID=2815810 RepID=UPI003F02CC97